MLAIFQAIQALLDSEEECWLFSLEAAEKQRLEMKELERRQIKMQQISDCK